MKTVYAIATAALLAAMAPMLSSCGGSEAQAQQPPTVVVEHLHAILRPDANGRWYVQTDEGPSPDPDHASVGVNWQVEQTSEYVRILFMRRYTHAGAIQVSSDDDFAGRVKGYSNLGLTSATIRIEVDGQRIDPGRILDYVPSASKAGNLWISATMVSKR